MKVYKNIIPDIDKIKLLEKVILFFVKKQFSQDDNVVIVYKKLYKKIYIIHTYINNFHFNCRCSSVPIEFLMKYKGE